MISKKYFLFKIKTGVMKREPELKFISQFLNYNSCSIDCGVLWGEYSLYMSKYSAKVFSIEANPLQVSFLKRVLPNNVEILDKAISDNDYDTLILSVPKNCTGHGTVSTEYSKEKLNYIVRTCTIDRILKNYDLPCSFIKLDVEGNEFKALLGSVNTLKYDKPTILCEITNVDLFSKIVKYLSVYNYKCFYLKHNSLSAVVDYYTTAGFLSQNKRAFNFIFSVEYSSY